MKSFSEMDLLPALQQRLEELEYHQPTAIQAQTIPAAIEGQDILGCAQTGTGKTAAFTLPILDYLGHEKPRAESGKPLALVLAPTRELAIQIAQSFHNYGKYVGFRQTLVYGGVGQNEQVRSLQKGAHVLIATPGRLIDLMDQGYIKLSDVEIFVLDEADRMLDMGFMPAIKKIIAKLPAQRQSMFFSATIAPKIRQLADQLLFNPFQVDVTPKTTSVKQIDQSVRMIQKSDKVDRLVKILREDNVTRTIVFTRTKHGANALAKKLEHFEIAAVAIHGNKSQSARQKALHAFRHDQIAVLVATDVAARGIDIDDVSHVVNFDMPMEPESYVHRVGRTGRAGASGVAISFCTPDERDKLREIEKLIGQPLKIQNPGEKMAEPMVESTKPSNAAGHNHKSGSRHPRQGAVIGGGPKKRFGKGRFGKRPAASRA